MRPQRFSSIISTISSLHLDDRGSQSRTYTSISAARADGNNARVWGGMHYPSTVAISDAEGEAIATYVNVNAMQRRQVDRR